MHIWLRIPGRVVPSPEFDVQQGHVDESPASFDVQPGHVEEEHGLLARGAHYAAKALPLAGGVLGAIPGAVGGAAVGVPTGPGALLTTAAGAGLGAGMGAGAGRAAQHVIDTALGYEKPANTIAEVVPKLADVAKAGGETAALTAAGEVGLPLLGKIPGVKQAAQAIPDAMGNIANRLAARMVKGNPSQYAKMGSEGIQKFGDFLLRKGAVRFGSSPANVAERIPGLVETTGADLGAATSALDATGGKVSKEALATRLDTLAEDAAKGGPGAAPVVAKYRNAAQAVRQEALESGEQTMSFAQAEKWKQGYQDPINYAKRSPTPPEMGSQQIASAARQNVEDAAAVAGEGTPLLEDFLKAKKESGFAQQAAAMVPGEEGRSMSRNILGPAAKAISYGAAGAAAMHGNVPGVVAALAAGPAYKFAQQRFPSTAAVTLKAGASAAEKLLAITRGNPASLGRYGAILSKALAEGDNSFNANVYALSQVDPQAQELFRRLSETDTP